MKTKNSSQGQGRGSQARNEERDSNGRFTSEHNQRGQGSRSSEGRKNENEERDSQGRFKSESSKK
ncbi:MAG: hypothetical protein LUF85_00555 [Bacteroides sp.]|nr:hypothetical protein [Bacteroides sp.]